MAANQREYRYLPGRIEYYIDTVRSIGTSGLKFNITGETPAANGIVFYLKHGVSFTSWGEKIRITLTPNGDQTIVDIFSECALPTQVVDWGKNRENIQSLFAYLMRGNMQPQQGYAPPQQGYAHPQQGYAPPQQGYAPPQYIPDNGTVICSNCGEVQPDTSVFCGACGTKL